MVRSALIETSTEFFTRTLWIGGTVAVMAWVDGFLTAVLFLLLVAYRFQQRRTLTASTQVQRYLQSQGFTNVYNVKEGMAGSGAGPGWIKRGLPVETCSTQC